MNLNAWRTRIVTVVAAIAAIWLGNKVAQAEFLWPALAAGAFAALAFSRLQPLPISTVVMGAALFGYIVGNRGFAQISVTGNIPILPAEFVLLVAGGILVTQSALRRELPVRRDILNTAILLWVASHRPGYTWT